VEISYLYLLKNDRAILFFSQVLPLMKGAVIFFCCLYAFLETYYCSHCSNDVLRNCSSDCIPVSSTCYSSSWRSMELPETVAHSMGICCMLSAFFCLEYC